MIASLKSRIPHSGREPYSQKYVNQCTFDGDRDPSPVRASGFQKEGI